MLNELIYDESIYDFTDEQGVDWYQLSKGMALMEDLNDMKNLLDKTSEPYRIEIREGLYYLFILQATHDMNLRKIIEGRR